MGFALREKAEQAVRALFEPGIVKAAATWPSFSVTSFLMVSRLRQLGLRPATIIDVGANVGQFAVAAAKLFPGCTVHSYEPLPLCHAKLKRSAAKVGNIQAKALALGDEITQLQLHVNTYSLSSSVLALGAVHKQAFPTAKEASILNVPSSTLDEEFGSAPLTHPVLLKIDVQGYESQVLKGGQRLLSVVDYIVVELSFQPLYAGEEAFDCVLDVLKSHAFDIMCPVGFLNDPRTGACLQMDGLFSRRGSKHCDHSLRAV